MADNTRKEIERLISDEYHGRTAKRFEPIGGDAIRGRASSVDRQGYLAARAECEALERQIKEALAILREALPTSTGGLVETARGVANVLADLKRMYWEQCEDAVRADEASMRALTALAKSRAMVRLLDQEKADAMAQADAMDALCEVLGERVDYLEAMVAALKAGRDAA